MSPKDKSAAQLLESTLRHKRGRKSKAELASSLALHPPVIATIPVLSNKFRTPSRVQIPPPAAEREEDRLIRSLLNDATLQKLQKLADSGSRFNQSWDNAASAKEWLWTVTETMAHGEASSLPAYRSALHLKINADHAATADREFNAVKDRFEQIIQKERCSTVPSELRVLEQRLCLEEEKFLHAKLKVEYTARFTATAAYGEGNGAMPRLLPKVRTVAEMLPR